MTVSVDGETFHIHAKYEQGRWYPYIINNNHLYVVFQTSYSVRQEAYESAHEWLKKNIYKLLSQV